MQRILAVVNQKGGVGKTTTSVNLAAALADRGLKVLLIDLDAQGNTTMSCGVNKRHVPYSVGNVLMGECRIQKAILPLSEMGISILPGNSELTGVDAAMRSWPDRYTRLRKVLGQLQTDYHAVILDCPPSINIMTLNALVAADALMIPMQCEYFALEGLSDLMETLEAVQANVNPNLTIEGLVRTLYDPRNRLSQEVSQQLQQHFGDRLYETVIPRNVKLAEAPGFGLSIIQHDPSSKGALAYKELAEEFLRRNPGLRNR